MTTMQNLSNSLEEYWMPFTANRQFKANPRIITGAQGMYYTTDHGDTLLDGSAGLFCVAAGHGRPEIAEAVHKTLLELDYVPPFQYGHPVSFELSRRLAALTPGDLNHIFFTNSGSEAVDSALKIALAYHKARGEGQCMRLVGRELAYHGVNFGGLSVVGMVNNRKAFGLGLPGVMHLRHTKLPEHTFVKGQPETGAELADDLQRFVDLHGPDSIAACIVEPIAGSAGTMARGICRRRARPAACSPPAPPNATSGTAAGSTARSTVITNSARIMFTSATSRIPSAVRWGLRWQRRASRSIARTDRSTSTGNSPCSNVSAPMCPSTMWASVTVASSPRP